MNSPHTSSVNSSAMRQILVPAVAPNIQRSANHPDFPLKVVINAKYIGAIIGHGGSTIRDISKVSRARCMVDVNNPTYDDNGSQENIIWISGTLENCSQACLRIMHVIQAELEKDRATGSHVELKIRVPNQLVGRLIGKGGSSVKKIMEESGTSVSISESRGNLDMYPLYQDVSSLERVITIRANSIDAVANAERKISHKLRNYYESDMNAGMMIPTGAAGNFGGALMGVPPFIIGSPNAAARDGLMNGFSGPPIHNAQAGGGHGGTASMFYQPAAGAAAAPLNLHHQLNAFGASGGTGAGSSPIASNYPAPLQMKSHIYVPDSVVGALIGTKGTHIRNMMLLTGANILIQGGPEAGKRHKFKDSKDSTSSAPASSTSENTNTSLPVSSDLNDDEKATDSNSNKKEESNEHLVKDELSSGETGQPKTSDAKTEELPSKDDEVKNEAAIEQEDKSNSSAAEITTTTTADITTTATAVKKEPNEKLQPSDANSTPAQSPVAASPIPSVVPPPSQTSASNSVSAVAGNGGGSAEKKPTVGNAAAVTGNPSDRCVTITGLDFQVLKAEFWVFQRIAESTIQFIDELVLTTETFVPSKIVGRIIGKNGQNVRELQRITQAIVKVPDDLHNPGDANGETPVRITGNYFALQAVQCRFSVLIAETEQRETEQNKRSRVSTYKGGNFSASLPAALPNATGGGDEKNSPTVPAAEEKNSFQNENSVVTALNEEKVVGSSV